MFLEVVLLKGDKLYQSKIENGETITFGGDKKDTVLVDEFVKNQISIKWKEKGLSVMAARAATMISPIANMAFHGSNSKKQNKKAEEYERARREKYAAYIDDQKARIASVAKVQHDIINNENPSPEECISIVNKMTHHRQWLKRVWLYLM